MKKRMTVALAAGALMVSMLPGVASAASGDSISASATIEGDGFVCTYLRITASVRSGPGGEPSGHIKLSGGANEQCQGLFEGPDTVRSGDIVCLLVDGDIGTAIATFKDDERPFGDAYPYLFITVLDGGPADEAIGGARTNDDCGQSYGSLTYPVVSGHVTVSDAS